MSKTAIARLEINVYVDCPRCDNLINLMDERDTCGYDFNEEGEVVRQACPDGYWMDEHRKFSISDIKCIECGETFDAKELEW